MRLLMMLKQPLPAVEFANFFPFFFFKLFVFYLVLVLQICSQTACAAASPRKISLTNFTTGKIFRYIFKVFPHFTLFWSHNSKVIKFCISIEIYLIKFRATSINRFAISELFINFKRKSLYYTSPFNDF